MQFFRYISYIYALMHSIYFIFKHCSSYATYINSGRRSNEKPEFNKYAWSGYNPVIQAWRLPQPPKKERKELRTLPEGNLGFRQVSDHTEYVHLYKSSENDNHYIRKGITKNNHLAGKLARKKYLQESIKTLEKEIALLENYLTRHMEPTVQNSTEHKEPSWKNSYYQQRAACTKQIGTDYRRKAGRFGDSVQIWCSDLL